jgi:hypothetical protein
MNNLANSQNQDITQLQGEITQALKKIPENTIEQENIEIEAAYLSNLLRDLQAYRIPYTLEELELIITLLFERKNIEAAKKKRIDLEKYARRYRNILHLTFINLKRAFSEGLETWSAPTKLVIGLLFALYVTYLPILFFLMWLIGKFSELDTGLLTIAGIGGGAGAVFSTLLRIRNLQSSPNEYPLIPLFTGFFKPAIGTLSGMLLLCLVQTGIIPLDKLLTVLSSNLDLASEQQKLYFILAYLNVGRRLPL